MNYNNNAKDMVRFMRSLINGVPPAIPVSDPVWGAYKFYTGKSLTGYEMQTFNLFDSKEESDKRMIAVLMASDIDNTYNFNTTFIDDIVCYNIIINSSTIASDDASYVYSALLLCGSIFTDLLKTRSNSRTVALASDSDKFISTVPSGLVYLAMRDKFGTDFINGIYTNTNDKDEVKMLKFYNEFFKQLDTLAPTTERIADILGVFSMAHLNTKAELFPNK